MAAVWDRHAKGDIQLIVDEMAVDKCNPECMQLHFSPVPSDVPKLRTVICNFH